VFSQVEAQAAMMSVKNYHYCVTIRSDDLGAVNCLRALADFSQKTGNKRRSWREATDEAWKDGNLEVTFHFTSPAYRESFLGEVKRLLPRNLWDFVAESDEKIVGMH
jgi:hypothetical protein